MEEICSQNAASKLWKREPIVNWDTGKIFISSHSMRLTLILHFALKSLLNSGLSAIHFHSGFNFNLKNSFIFGGPLSKSQISHRDNWNNWCGTARIQKLQKGSTTTIFSGMIINYLVLYLQNCQIWALRCCRERSFHMHYICITKMYFYEYAL